MVSSLKPIRKEVRQRLYDVRLPDGTPIPPRPLVVRPNASFRYERDCRNLGPDWVEARCVKSYDYHTEGATYIVRRQFVGEVA